MWRSPKINLHQNWSIAPSPWCSASIQHSLCQSGTIVMGPYKPSAMMLRYHKLRWIRFKSHRPFWFKQHLTKKTHNACHQILLASCFRYHQSGFFVSFERAQPDRLSFRRCISHRKKQNSTISLKKMSAQSSIIWRKTHRNSKDTLLIHDVFLPRFFRYLWNKNGI